MLDPFVSAPLFSLFCASNIWIAVLKTMLCFSIRSVSADTVVLFMPLFLICLLFIFILFLRTGSVSLPLRHVCANDRAQGRGSNQPRLKKKNSYSRVAWSRLLTSFVSLKQN
jgi:hypothetical protein